MAFALFVLVACAYRLSPERELLDPKYALLTTESLVTTGSWDLSPFLPGLAAAVRAGTVAGIDDSDPKAADAFDDGAPRGERDERRMPYQLRAVGGRLLYHYPPGTSLLSAPLFAAQRLVGATTLDRRGIYSMAKESPLQGTYAALFAAAAVVLGFRIARRELPIGPAAVAAAVAAFGSGWWSVASRALWSHSWTAVLLAAALLELLRWEDGRARRPALLAALLVAAFWVRPTNAFPAAAFALYVAWHHRAALARLAAVGAAGFALYVGFSLAVFSSWFPTYMSHVVPHGRLEPVSAFVGQLLSAEHGLLLFSPILFFVAWSLARRGVARERQGIALLSLALVGFYLLYHSWRARWWGAGTVGPRFLCDVTPHLLWLGAHAWRRAREAPARGAFALWSSRALVALLALAGVAAHATGAFHVIPGQTGGKPRGERHEILAPLGSSLYWKKLPQVATVRWLLDRARHSTAAGAVRPGVRR